MGWRAKVAPVTPTLGLEALSKDVIPFEWNNEFPVVVRVTAPNAPACTTLVDLVVVLDMSANMSVEMLRNVKKAMLDVVTDRGSEDRFSMVSFSGEVKRHTQLTSMSRDGLEKAFSEVDKLVARGKSDIPAALQQAAEIINEAKKRGEGINRNSFIVLFSASKNDSIYTESIRCEFPVYTFGLGDNHDPLAMFHIAENTCGTYSSIKDMEKMGSALGKFIQMEKSVVATNIKIPFCTHDEVTITSISSGSQKNEVDKNEMSGQVVINRLYAGREVLFTVFLDVPEVTQGFLKNRMKSNQKMKLMTVCGMNEGIRFDKPVELFVKRTADNKPSGKVCSLVAAELKRLELLRGISRLSKNPTADGFETMYNELLKSQDHHLVSKWKLEENIWEMRKGISDANNHRMQGLQQMLSWLSSHNWQRATAMGSPYIPYIPDNFLRTSTMEHTMCRAALQLLPCTMSALVILLLAVLFGLYTGMIPKLWPALQLMMTSSTVATVMNRAIQQYLYSAVTIFAAFSTFVSKEVVSIEQKAQKLEQEKDEGMKIFRQTILSERANIAAYPKACGGKAGMPTIQILEIETLAVVAT